MSQLTLTLGIYGDAKLTNEKDRVVWSSETDEESPFDDFIEEDDTDEVIEYLRGKKLVDDSSAVEIIVEVAEDEDESEDDKPMYAIPSGEF